MSNPYLFLALGLLLIFLECCLPGMILGILGSTLIALSLSVFFVQAESGALFFLQALGVFTSVALVLLAAFKFIRTTKKTGSLYLESDQEGYVASQFDKELIGKQGAAMTDLRPAGHVLIDGKLLQAVSDSSYIEKGQQIRVLRGQGAVLVVEKVT